MKFLSIALIYLFMLVFDAGVLYGAFYLITEKNWSEWTFLAAVIIGMGSYPASFIKKVEAN